MKKIYHKHIKPKAEKMKASMQRKLSNVKKRHIRTSVAIIGVIFLSVVTMLIVYRNSTVEINWVTILIVSAILGFLLGGIEYLYIIRVKGY